VVFFKALKNNDLSDFLNFGAVTLAFPGKLFIAAAARESTYLSTG